VRLFPTKVVLSPTLKSAKLPICQTNVKYFNEVGECQRHVDIRYYNDDLSYNQTMRMEMFKQLLDSYSAFLLQNHLQSWIAHGTLLGWFWGQKSIILFQLSFAMVT
jgi:hypothetical protein